MKLGALAALDQRIGLRYAMPPMSAAETASYLRHHLALAGRSDTLFSDDAAVALIHQTSRGYPGRSTTSPCKPLSPPSPPTKPSSTRNPLAPPSPRSPPNDHNNRATLTISATTPTRPRPAPRRRGLLTSPTSEPVDGAIICTVSGGQQVTVECSAGGSQP
jgi:hypothetical protein